MVMFETIQIFTNYWYLIGILEIIQICETNDYSNLVQLKKQEQQNIENQTFSNETNFGSE